VNSNNDNAMKTMYEASKNVNTALLQEMDSAQRREAAITL